MPFKSEKQRDMLFAKKPAVAKKIAKKYGTGIKKVKSMSTSALHNYKGSKY